MIEPPDWWLVVTRNDINESSRLVWLYLRGKLRSYSLTICEPVTEIAAATGLHARSVYRSLIELERAHLLTRTPTKVMGRGGVVNVYTLARPWEVK